MRVLILGGTTEAAALARALTEVEVVAARGPFRVEDETALLAQHRIDVLVAKNSGGDDAKLAAARRLGIHVVLVERPPLPEGDRVSSVEEAVQWIQALPRPRRGREGPAQREGGGGGPPETPEPPPNPPPAGLGEG